jgi:glycosyltransferase involved in cell wall biosynthesis
MTERPIAAPTFAIIVPTYNEAADIGATCEALLALAPPPDEIIFVDGASTDGTADIIRRHLIRPSMRVIVEDAKRGPATARNVGVAAATSEVVVFVDGDVRLPTNFLGRLSTHYQQGADTVAVEMDVPNIQSVFGRYAKAVHEHSYGSGPLLFSQAFSCRRRVALDAGLFPVDLPGAEDFEFGRRLARQTNRQVVDRTIVVNHLMPATMRGFWHMWRWRGASLPILRYRVHRAARLRIVAERAAAAIWSLLLLMTIVPTVGYAAALSSRSMHRWIDFPRFLALVIIQRLAHRVGEWKGVYRLFAAPSDAR